jgi:hypothetical protein
MSPGAGWSGRAQPDRSPPQQERRISGYEPSAGRGVLRPAADRLVQGVKSDVQAPNWPSVPGPDAGKSEAIQYGPDNSANRRDAAGCGVCSIRGPTTQRHVGT